VLTKGLANVNSDILLYAGAPHTDAARSEIVSSVNDHPEYVDDIVPPIIGGTLHVLNILEAEKIIGRYAIGGSIGLLFYTEPVLTDDMDVFCHLPQTGLLTSLAPVYGRLQQMGYQPDGQFISIEGVLVQLLLPPSSLVEEALQNAVETEAEGVSTRVFQYEYLLAIMTETNRAKDRAKIANALESASPDEAKLQNILRRYNLLDRWRKITE